MSSISKRLSLRVPANVIYRSLNDTRLEQLFPEFFAGVTRKLTISNNKANSELQFTTTTYDSQIQIKEIFKLKVLHSNATEITYTTSTNMANDPVVESIVLIVGAFSLDNLLLPLNINSQNLSVAKPSIVRMIFLSSMETSKL